MQKKSPIYSSLTLIRHAGRRVLSIRKSLRAQLSFIVWIAQVAAAGARLHSIRAPFVHTSFAISFFGQPTTTAGSYWTSGTKYLSVPLAMQIGEVGHRQLQKALKIFCRVLSLKSA